MRLCDEAHGPEISAALEETAGRNVSRGALYSALARLERKDFLTWNIVASSDARGGSPNRCFSVTSDGIIALRASRSALLHLWDGLEDVLGEQR